MSSERIISLKNLFWKIVEAWKRILVIGVVCAILLPCLKYASDNMEYNNKRESVLELENNADEEMYQKYYKLKENVEIAEFYKEFSIYETTNLSKIYQVVYKYAFDNRVANSEEVANSIINYYTSDEFLNVFTKEYHEENSDEIAVVLREVINASLHFEAEKYYVQITVLYEENGTIGTSDVEYSDLLSYVEETSKENALIMESKIKSKIDTNEINVNRTALQTLVDIEQKRLNDYAKENNIVDPDFISIEEPSVNISYIIIGFALGAILVCVVVVIKALFTDDLQEIEEISCCYKVGNVEILVKQDKRNLIDKKLQEIKYKKELPIENALAMFAAVQKCKCGNTPIFISSSLGKEFDSEVKNLIEEKFKSANVDICIGDNVNSNVEDFEKMRSIGKVLFVEKLEQSKHEGIKREITIARENNVEIIGFLVIS